MAGAIVHVLNRAARRATLFSTPEDYAAFERVFVETLREVTLPVAAFCVMPNHWHFVALPESNERLAKFIRRLSHTHAMRWHASRGTTGTGAVYQGRYKAFRVEPSTPSILRVMRYVERNALRAGICTRAEDWRHGSLWHRVNGDPHGLLCPPPVELPADWTEHVNSPQPVDELNGLRRCVNRNLPFGSQAWLAAQIPARGPGRPRQERGRVHFQEEELRKGETPS